MEILIAPICRTKQPADQAVDPEGTIKSIGTVGRKSSSALPATVLRERIDVMERSTVPTYQMSWTADHHYRDVWKETLDAQMVSASLKPGGI